jgi:hypothetical protein
MHDFLELADDEDMYPDRGILDDLADDLRRRTPGQAQRAALEYEERTTNLQLALGRTVFDHLVIQMALAQARGVDPGRVIEAFEGVVTS